MLTAIAYRYVKRLRSRRERASSPQVSTAQSAAEGEVRAVIDRFLDAAGRLDFDAMAALFAPGASIGGAVLRDGRWVTTAQSAEDFLATERRRGYDTPYQEPVGHWTVHCDDGQIAFVRADATIVLGGQVRSRNIDYFTLLRDGDGAWKIVNGSYTAKPLAP